MILSDNTIIIVILLSADSPMSQMASLVAYTATNCYICLLNYSLKVDKCDDDDDIFVS